jgi:quercetin dioxygenase-like cupin family protein
MSTHPLPLHVSQAPDPVDGELEALLSEPFASVWVAAEPDTASTSGPVRSRLLERLAASRATASTMLTARRKRLAAAELAPGVLERTLYLAPHDRALRPGEPVRARLIELQAGASWSGPDAGHHREWLVLRGAARMALERLQLRDYHAVPAGMASHAISSDEGAWLFLRESVLAARAGDAPLTVRDVDAGWSDYAPGIQRRVLWQRDGQAAMLYYTQPGAVVPLHSHGHDEECLMLQGELFLDDVLLQEGDYQIAPAGTAHHITQTDTGVVLYAHGDLDLNFLA